MVISLMGNNGKKITITKPVISTFNLRVHHAQQSHKTQIKFNSSIIFSSQFATDDICAPCPKRRGALCTSQDKIAALDAAHAEALHLTPGDRLTWGEAQARIRANVPPGSLKTLCQGCEWEPYGMCEEALAGLHAK